jgi:tetratricopeptide (TPR) repeat protein
MTLIVGGAACWDDGEVTVHYEKFLAAVGEYGAGRYAAAERLCREIVAAGGADAGVWNTLGLALDQQGDRQRALRCFEEAIAASPTYSAGHYNLGNAWKELGRFEEAIACYRRAVELNPAFVEAHSNLGTVLLDRGKSDEAIRCFRQALQVRPDLAILHFNLGGALTAQGDIAQAVACYRKSLELEPGFAQAHYSLSMLLLMMGDFAHGWIEHEWRGAAKKIAARRLSQPKWNGRSISGKTILLQAEQGLGDTLQFVRYATLVQQLGARVVFECQRPLLNLVARCRGIDVLVAEGAVLPEFDFHARLMSLPAILKTQLGTIPAHVPYLIADPALVAMWKEKLKDVKGLRIGINWRGDRGPGTLGGRAIPVEFFETLARMPGVRLVSLQKEETGDRSRGSGDRSQGTATVGTAHPTVVNLGEIDTEQGAFMDTAAVMMSLDLVITCDTSIAHLAGGLGVPVWVALPFVPDWRWLLNRSDSPWYPTMRLFRQKKAGDWAGVFEEIEAALRQVSGFKFQVSS